MMLMVLHTSYKIMKMDDDNNERITQRVRRGVNSKFINSSCLNKKGDVKGARLSLWEFEFVMILDTSVTLYVYMDERKG